SNFLGSLQKVIFEYFLFYACDKLFCNLKIRVIEDCSFEFVDGLLPLKESIQLEQPALIFYSL
ncbi:hypothetical protein, partial [Enterococcus gallinarum]